jgi:hypothetical protein
MENRLMVAKDDGDLGLEGSGCGYKMWSLVNDLSCLLAIFLASLAFYSSFFEPHVSSIKG